MCTIAMLVDVVAGAPLVIAANRDELYARPTRPPELLARFGDGIVGGVDALSGGTWLAIARDGRFAAVTNQRALAPAIAARSRGLVVGELCGARDMDAHVAALDPTHYASMNLAWAEPGRPPQIAYLRHDGAREVIALGRGIHVLCNDRLEAPGFPRGERLATAIAGLVDRPWPALAAALVPCLADHTRRSLADTPPSDLPVELARELTCACIHTPSYGTRSATITALGDGVLGYLHADGAPCVTPFADLRELLA